MPIRVVPVDADLSFDVGMLRPLTLPGGLSLGDRYCLALARWEGVPALTTERRWPDIATAAGVLRAAERRPAEADRPPEQTEGAASASRLIADV